MIQKISVPVSVDLVFNHKKRIAYPKSIFWDGKLYQNLKIGFHHTFYEGKNLIHVFSMCSETLFFRISLNTTNLHWRLEEISDGF